MGNWAEKHSNGCRPWIRWVQKREDNSVNAERNSGSEFESERNTEIHALQPGSEHASPIEELKNHDLDHVPDSYWDKLRGILREFTPMWDGALGTIGIT